MSRNVPIGHDNLHIKGGNSGLMGLENDAFYRQWSRGNPTVAPSGRSRQLSDRGNSFNSYMKMGVNEEIVDLGGATSVLSTNNLLPAGSLIDAVVCTPVVELTTPTTYNVGDSSSNTRFGTGNDNDGSASHVAAIVNTSHWAGTVAIRQASAGKVKLTPNAAGSGKIHVAVYFRQFVGSQN